jgi:hypothetical protein
MMIVQQVCDKANTRTKNLPSSSPVYLSPEVQLFGGRNNTFLGLTWEKLVCLAVLGLALARQALYCLLESCPSPLYALFFGLKSCISARGQPWTMIQLLMPPNI